MILRKLTVKNFQCYKRAVLRFHPRFNVIVGESNEGKSALLRSIKLAMKNRPIGTRYYSNFAGKKGATRVKLLFKDVKIELIKRIIIGKNGKGRVSNQKYVINDENPLSGFKTTVPNEVTSAFNMSDLNIQYQLDSPFILAASGGGIAQIINAVTGLEKVDGWQSTVNARIRTTQAEIKVGKAEIKRLKKEHSTYSGLDEIKQKIVRYRVMDRESDVVWASLNEIKATIKTLESAKRQIKDLKGIIADLREYRKQLRSLDVEPTKHVIALLERFITNKKKIKKTGTLLQSKLVDYSNTLNKLGVCPFCYSKIKDTKKLMEVLM